MDLNLSIITGIGVLVLAMLVLSLVRQNRDQQWQIDWNRDAMREMLKEIIELKRQLDPQPELEATSSGRTACRWGGPDYIPEEDQRRGRG
ncbi:hypothetical protein SAMN06297280_2111 [Arsukibacterium tuosuense]|uniref:Uncharacterized protein n=1 Tax=Arsukibacterium tuosuense TaxID=1323745 RepID=A0A285IWK0_9GAMM|nr:hypothetical protein [Arsukibacterium tuosuense]SNY52415.1 hypothetical protein SAMN06297280_2111 [Arsukibacterium tuosuense]